MDSKTWSYRYSFIKHFDWLKPLASVLVVSNLIIAFALFLGSPTHFIKTLKEMGFVFHMINGIFIFSALLSMLIFRKGYVYHYVLDKTEIRTVSPSYGVNHETTTNIKIGNHVYLNSIKELRLNLRENCIKIRGPLTFTTVYGEKNDLLEAWEFLCQNSPATTIITED